MDYSLLVGVKRERFRVLPTQQFSSLSQPEFNLSDLQGIDLIYQKANSIDQNTKENFIMSETNLSDINIQPKISSVSTSNNANEDDIDKNNTTVNHGLWRLQSKMINEQDMFKRELDGAIKAQVVEGPGSYYIGIIDILQEWNWSKFIERWTKIVLKCNDSDGLSAVPPENYSERFWKRCVIDVFEGIDIYNDDLFSDNPSRLN
ncbi:MAG: phosphatidylinositol phosphate kinase family protein [Actinobacteria bacterium]|nr:phosphatidylinositol phosphate kinase family protein [Actinomycetota bacterium]